MITGADTYPELDERPVELPSDRIPGRRAGSIIAGAVGGLFGGLVALVVADGATSRTRLMEHLRIAAGASPGPTIASVGTIRAWIVAALVVGLVAGAVFGGLTRRLVPMVARVVFGALLLPATWTAVYALVLPRVAPWVVTRVPFGPSLLGALALGVSLALARATRRGPRRSRFEEFEQQLLDQELEAEELAAPDSFPLVRRRGWSRG